MMNRIFVLFVILVLAGCSGGGGGAGRPRILTRAKVPPPKKLNGTAVVFQDTAPSKAAPGAEVKLAEMALATNQPNVFWSSLKLAQTGTAGDADISAVKIYLDDGNDTFEPLKDVHTASGSFKDGVAEIALADHALASIAQLYFITAELSPSAAEGATVGVKVADASCCAVTDPVGVTAELPFLSGFTLVAKESVTPERHEAAPAREAAPEPVETDPLKAFLREQEKDKTVKMQENEFIAQKHYEMALQLFREFKYRQALDHLETALQLNPHHKEAEKLRTEIRMILGSQAEEIKTIKNFMENQLAVKMSEIEIEVRNHFLKGERLFAEKNYKEAVPEFEAVEEKVKWIPYETDLKRYLDKARPRLKECRELQSRQEEELARQQRIAAEKLATEEELRRRQEFNEKIKKLFHEAIVSFEQKRYDHTEELADKILEFAPYFHAARELKKEATRARHYKISQDYLALKAERLKDMADEFAETVIPYAEDKIVRYDSDVWKVASHRKPPGIIESKATEDPDLVDIQRKLKTIKHNFILDGTKSLYDIMDYIAQQYKITVQFDGDVRTENIPEDKKTLTLTSVPLETCLKNLLELYNLTYILKTKSLWIIKASTVTEELEWRVHNVDDLVRPIPEFVGPTIELQASAAGGGWQAPQSEQQAIPVMPIDELITLVKNNTGKDAKGKSTWEGGEAAIAGATINRMGESNRMMIVHTKIVQQEITEFLNTLRSFRSAMIAIEATFLNTTDNALEDVGIQLRDISPATPNNIAEALLPGIAGPYGAGIWRSNDPQRDLRFRTAYTFRDAGAVSEFQVGGRLRDTGGLGLQWTILQNPQINMLLRMLQKTGKGTILDSPKIVALNGQRVNVSFIRQRHYIQDLEVIAGAIAYEPVIGVFAVGAVLDVKPVMSYDRKFITVHAFPSLLHLQQLRRFDINPDAPETFLELPWVQLQRVRTSAVIPDKGALLLGGMKKITERSISASTPVFEKIPILGALFRRKTKSEEKEKIIILIKAEIIELPEIEKSLE
ncbi:MAG: hypothetical protein HY762_02910 [Planctomycetes bacterium]|nr:hypothetical protein [Planctomycetota bacterium]